MKHEDHVNLLRGGVPTPGGIWADFGSGTGAFTLALAELVGTTGQIYSIDQNGRALKEQERVMRSRFPGVTVHYINADFTTKLNLPPLNGVVMANSLHFLRHKDAVLQMIHSYLQPGGRLILVEYNVDSGNTWVPYPLSYHTWETLARKNRFTETRQLASVPSRFLGQIYSAISTCPPITERKDST
jgi:ubiquinone/menaquinone biosynthesis C-methylase UbiE